MIISPHGVHGQQPQPTSCHFPFHRNGTQPSPEQCPVVLVWVPQLHDSTLPRATSIRSPSTQVSSDAAVARLSQSKETSKPPHSSNYDSSFCCFARPGLPSGGKMQRAPHLTSDSHLPWHLLSLTSNRGLCPVHKPRSHHGLCNRGVTRAHKDKARNSTKTSKIRFLRSHFLRFSVLRKIHFLSQKCTCLEFSLVLLPYNTSQVTTELQSMY